MQSIGPRQVALFAFVGRMKYLAILIIAATALSGGAFARDTGPLLRYQLANGLDVILVPDHRVPKVVVDIGYKVGAVNEPPGRSGFAHLFEHLMFMGTPAYPDIDAAYGTVGADINASTWNDYTVYYTRGLASALPYMLAIEADRMANQGAAITAEDLDTQREVVLNEMRQNTLDTLGGSALLVAQAQLYPKGHPYSRSIIGSMADLKMATIADVHGFFDTFYVPNNAVLALVGDFEPETAKALIEDTFGRIARGAVPPTFNIPEVTPQRARTELVDRVPTPRLFFSWATAPLRDADNSLLRLSEQLLGNDEYGVLRDALVDKGIADNAWAYLWGGNLGGQFVVEVSVAEGVDVAAAEAATRAAIASYLAAPQSEAEVASERRKIILGDRVANEDQLTFADNIITYTIAADEPGYAAEDDPYIAAATPAEVLDAARKNLQPEDASLAIVRPGERGSYPPMLTEATGTAEPFTAPERPHVDMPELEAAEPAVAAPPVAETATLSNGIEVVHYDMPDAPMAFLAARSAAGTLSDPEGREGTIELAAVMGTNGAGDLGPAA
ncbi:MAG TPA: pitrilysin family protein, partial [Devosia sp.]|nr:pitrilysin family protein [Devosia sp.]